MRASLSCILTAALSVVPIFGALAGTTEILNASYDVARPLYRDLNPAFIADWQKTHSDTLTINQSHGGSSAQARAVIEGLAADVVTMNNSLDIDAIAKAGLLQADWATKLPHGASPSWSAIVFVVRKGNPKNLHDWGDLIQPGVQVVLPNPKTSGNGRYSYLAAWQWARKRPGGSDTDSIEFEKRLFANVPVLDSGGRGATTSFAQRGIGDVLLTFENEAKLIQQEFAGAGVEVVYPSLSVRADNPVAVVEKNVEKKGTSAVAKAYLDFHYTAAAQEIIAKDGLRPISETVLKAHTADFPKLELFTVDQAFGGWAKAQSVHFADGGSFDTIIAARSAH